MSDEDKMEDEHQWKEEANAVIGDVRNHVQELSISSKLRSTNKKIYLNLITFEKEHYCIELTPNGFRIVGNKFDSIDDVRDEYFETPYSLLDSLSPRYRESFGEQLLGKLAKLQKDNLEK